MSHFSIPKRPNREGPFDWAHFYQLCQYLSLSGPSSENFDKCLQRIHDYYRVYHYQPLPGRMQNNPKPFIREITENLAKALVVWHPCLTNLLLDWISKKDLKKIIREANNWSDFEILYFSDEHDGWMLFYSVQHIQEHELDIFYSVCAEFNQETTRCGEFPAREQWLKENTLKLEELVREINVQTYAQGGVR